MIQINENWNQYVQENVVVLIQHQYHSLIIDEK